tara:strand:- start:309 stop:857 length:549 start_codon:yes stop_codon:yes gene_type:complete
MKKLLFLCLVGFLLSCSSDDKSTVTEVEVNLSIDHFKTTSLLHGTAFVVSENGAEKQMAIPFITSFDFQPGFRYQASATRRTIVNDGTSKGVDTYHLISVQSQDTIAPNTTFRVPLAQFVNGFGYVKWVVGNADTGYVLSNEIPIDCQQFCGELESMLVIEDNVTGEFEHGPNGSYILRALF